VIEEVAQLIRYIGSTNNNNDLEMVRIMGASDTRPRQACKGGFRKKENSCAAPISV